MCKLIPFFAVFGGCGLNLPDFDSAGGDEDGDDGVVLPTDAFHKVVNKTGNTIVLIGENLWDTGDNFWVFDCAEDVVSDLDVSLAGGVLTIASTDASVREDCLIKVKADGGVTDIDSDGNGNVTGQGDVAGVKWLHVTGNGDVALGTVSADRLTVTIEGSGEVTLLDLTANTLELDLRGNGDALFLGAVDEGRFYVTGNGDLSAKLLVLQGLYVELGGNGDATVTVEDTIDGSVGGSGTLDVYGSPDGGVTVTGAGAVVFYD